MIQENIEIEFYDGTSRQVRVLLPDDYTDAETAYPVLYMFDGQNVFDVEDSYTGVTWEVREAMEGLLEEDRIQPMIIVAIDHAEERRLQEYGPFPMKFHGQVISGGAAEFGEFLVHSLIPELEDRYPMIAEPWARAIAGSSMGGIITAYLSLEYPNVFSRAGIFSLASWISKRAFNQFVKEHASPTDNQYFVQVGGREGLNVRTGKENQRVSKAYVKASVDFVRQLEKGGVDPRQIQLHVGEEHWHSESCWREYMTDFLLWLQES